ncbi:HEAT repeat domain-containing protein [Gimesia chilikensis]|uniref:HEAT repeat domain-containing protein n=1 Tax=Gimesia chilikensis TaxID=2605989 RepID=UPI0011ED7236|nr:HEAT repeat domain-containing protein [Gimesia chilikensis]KAA0137070.1 HEAT repeat domain-containing protein [Gimesia chilikensis]
MKLPCSALMFPGVFRLAVVLCLTLGLCHSAQEVRADLIKLKQGGEIRGKLLKESAGGETTRTIETLSGGRISVDAQQIDFVTNRPLVIEEYESRAHQIKNTVEAHLELSEWCRENFLTTPRLQELEKVIELDPDHEQARAALGYTLRDGEWMTRDQIMRKNGYVKYKGRYVSSAELELLEKNQADLEAERAWSKKINLWVTWLTSQNPQYQSEGLQNIQNINDPNAVAGLARNLGKHENLSLRSLLVTTLQQIPGHLPLRPLAELALTDPHQAIRDAALQALSARDASQAIVFFIEALKHKSNLIVQRAGAGLAAIGDREVVPELIDALTTSHTYRVRVPDATSTYSFNSNGSFGGSGVVLPPEIEAGLLAGRYPNGVIVLPSQQPKVRMRTVSVKHVHQNSAVLDALQKLTEQNFGYNQRLWRLWWSSVENQTGIIPAIP